jgi:hypothetical protein
MADGSEYLDGIVPRLLFAGRDGDPKPSLLATPIGVPYNGSDWLVSLVQAMVYLPPLVPVLRDAAIGDSPCAGWWAFVGLARREQTTVLGALSLAVLVSSLATASEELLANCGPGLLRSPDTALDLLTIPGVVTGSVVRSAPMWFCRCRRSSLRGRGRGGVRR